MVDLTALLKTLSDNAGVYQMYNAQGKILYVGKAKNLKKRVSSYFKRALDTKTQVLVNQIADIQTTVTADETEALLLEAALIKEYKPRYNVLLRDDKSYPYLYLNSHQTFPRLDFYRGAKNSIGRYFGPFPDAGAVRETLALVQKLFKLRQCRDDFFKKRTKPCLQYQIKRCTAPCVGYVDASTYRQQVEDAVLFLDGKSDAVLKRFNDAMEQAAFSHQYEEAAYYRDHIIKLRRLQKQQFILQEKEDVDVIGLYTDMGYVVFEILFIRHGRLIGHKAFFPSMPQGTDLQEAFSAFLIQYYLNPIRENDIPKKVILGEKIKERLWIERALCEKLKRPISIRDQRRPPYKRLQTMANLNAKESLSQHLFSRNTATLKLEALQKALQLPNSITRIECFDVSHTMGEATVAACVVFGEEGFNKSDYRKFNISGISKGDDYQALAQALTRRYTRVKAEEGKLPDVLIIDGGKGQLSFATSVLEELQISGVVLVGIAKGITRKRGLEKVYLGQASTPIEIRMHPLAFTLLQAIRDEAHRFAILAHRTKRQKERLASPLEQVEGIGPARRRQLLRYFGGLQELKTVGVDEIAKVPGMSEKLARRLYDKLHE